MNSINLRQAFINQLGHYLIVDLAELNTPMLNNLTNVVQRVLTLACSVRGGVRIPAFGLSILHAAFTQVHEFDTIRGDYNDIIRALNSLPAYKQINDKLDGQGYKDILYLAMHSAIRSYKDKQERKSWTNMSRIEITLVTVKNRYEIESYLQTFVNEMDVSKLHKIKVIELTDSTFDVAEEQIAQTGFVETLHLNGTDCSDLENYFKTWLFDQCDQYDVILHFPGPECSHLRIQCDIIECLLNPLSLPFGHRFSIQVDSLSIQLNGISSAKTAPAHVPVYELNVLSRIDSSKICESLLFGMPLCLRPTKSWQLNWTEQIENLQCFNEVCRQLTVSEQFLIVRMRQCYQTDTLLPYYLLIPGVERSAERSAKVFCSLQNVELIYNLDNTRLDSGLLSSLTANLKHSRKKPLPSTEPATKKLKRNKTNTSDDI